MRAAISRVVRSMARSLGSSAHDLDRLAPSTTVGEIASLDARQCSGAGPRINIVLPSINAAHYFGGIHTAISLYQAVIDRFPRSRILLMDSAPDSSALARFNEHVPVAMEEDSDAARQIVPCNDRYGRTLPVGRGDVWLATAWWTAYAAQRLARWQASHDGLARSIAYLVQDYEPGFYPWSSQHALALSTYRPADDLAIFNTQLLADYFCSQGIRFQSQVVFEPTINDGLRPALEIARRSMLPRDRRIVVYARPSTPRNAFELVCEGLRHWGWTDPQSARWEVVAPGELCEDVDLGPFKLKALGKLDIDRYAELLSTSAVGLSLMISPHPSYPPLEMAAFGMRVVTNNFGNKDLSSFSDNVASAADMSPSGLAATLASACSACELRSMQPASIMKEEHPFLAMQNASPVARALVSHWQRVGLFEASSI